MTDYDINEKLSHLESKASVGGLALILVMTISALTWFECNEIDKLNARIHALETKLSAHPSPRP